MSIGYETFDYYATQRVLEDLPFLLRMAKTRRSISHQQMAREIGIGVNTLKAMMRAPGGQLSTLVLVLSWLERHDPQLPHSIGPVRVENLRGPIERRIFRRSCNTCGEHFKSSEHGQVNRSARLHVEDQQRSMVAAFRNHLDRVR